MLSLSRVTFVLLSICVVAHTAAVLERSEASEPSDGHLSIPTARHPNNGCGTSDIVEDLYTEGSSPQVPRTSTLHDRVASVACHNLHARKATSPSVAARGRTSIHVQGTTSRQVATGSPFIVSSSHAYYSTSTQYSYTTSTPSHSRLPPASANHSSHSCSTSSSLVRGLIATICVLALLLVIAIIAIIVLGLKYSRQRHSHGTLAVSEEVSAPNTTQPTRTDFGDQAIPLLTASRREQSRDPAIS